MQCPSHYLFYVTMISAPGEDTEEHWNLPLASASPCVFFWSVRARYTKWKHTHTPQFHGPIETRKHINLFLKAWLNRRRRKAPN